jgi:prepilin peptidase CpaA
MSEFAGVLELLNQDGRFLFPLAFAAWIAVGDVRTRRIPNLLNLAIALSGLGFQGATGGWTGLAEGVWGLLLGFGLLFPLYWLKGMGAGDVKALAALGAWLGPWLTFVLFLYMGVAGGVMSLLVLIRRGLLRAKLRQGWVLLVNWWLRRPFGRMQEASAPAAAQPAPTTPVGTPGIPYGVAIFCGMAILFLRGGLL